MILADTRHSLTRDDAQLVARLIARDSGADLAEIERELADHGSCSSGRAPAPRCRCSPT
jgi:hypothetical protein